MNIGALGGEETRAGRADAQRNHRRILEAAEEVFSREGASAPIDLVAERAGVGVGTLYRHFPTKEALFEAIVLARIEELLQSARSRVGAEDPEAALFDYLAYFAAEAAAKRDVLDAIASSGIDIKSRCAVKVEEVAQALGQLLEQAQQARAVRGDVSAQELMALMSAAVQAACAGEAGAASAERIVAIVCEGIRVHHTPEAR